MNSGLPSETITGTPDAENRFAQAKALVFEDSAASLDHEVAVSKLTRVELAFKDVLDRRPALAQLLKKYGDLNVLAYATGLFSRRGSVSDAMLQAVQDLAAPVLGPELTGELVEQLRICPVINTANHHAPLFYPAAFQANLLAAHGVAGAGLKVIPTFAGSGVPLDNSDFPRGIIWDGAKISLTPANQRQVSVFAYPAVTADKFSEALSPDRVIPRVLVSELLRQVEQAVSGHPKREYILTEFQRSPEQTLRQLQNDETVSPQLKHELKSSLPALREQGARVVNEIDRAFKAYIPEDFFEARRYHEQISMLNVRLWNSTLGRDPSMPKLSFLPIEPIVSKLLVQSFRQGDDLHHMVFDSSGREDALERFKGISGAWNGDREGTHFFWAIGDLGELVALRFSNGTFEGRAKGQRYAFNADVETITTMLEQSKIIPGVLMTMLCLVKHGAHPVGGYNQVNYLETMIGRAQEFRQNHGFRESHEAHGDFKPDGFVYGPTTLIDAGASGELRQASFDFALKDPRTVVELSRSLARQITLRQATVLGLTELHPEIIPIAERANLSPAPSQDQLVTEVGINIPQQALNSGRPLVRFQADMENRRARVISISESGQFPSYTGRLERFAKEEGFARIYYKTDREMPTGSHKDRASQLLVADAREKGFSTTALSTCGNFGASMSSICAVHGLNSVIVIPESYHAPRIPEMEYFGAKIIRFGRTYEDAVAYCAKVSIENGWYDANPGGPNAELHIRGYATIAREIIRDLRKPGLPEIIALPVSNGTTLAGLLAGFKEALAAGEISSLPRFVAASTPRMNPIIQSYLMRSRICVDLAPEAIKETAVNEPLINWHSLDGQAALDALYESNGFAVEVPDSELIKLQERLRTGSNENVLEASCAGFAALLNLKRQGIITGAEPVLALFTAKS